MREETSYEIKVHDEIEPVVRKFIFTDCILENVKIHGVDEVEIRISSLPRRIFKRLKLWAFGGVSKYS